MSSPNADAQRKVRNRLSRARGQLDALIAAVDEGAPCRDVVTQLAAVTHALNRAGFLVVATALEECVSAPEDAEARDGLTTEELEKLFLSLA
ncbi:transcriptional regulator [Pseudoclavibacter sp. RFBJ3]|uniref:metal-sensitive transcriptional regulator n=1 Tax=unclassified Pseudoclavibacter TaxID=2615177 RepID=UPI000CE76799|nr:MULTISPECIES: metal-sensitive transcriptional regulator [unclassified Pseudoclavibacter]PPF87520.1 transcriptional regulator [Pseudoclavibacter sp. RFBJ5]PPF90370.1 transcriptional regulator [Pseudoclavibacter sp. RFBJ3]PPG01055.1 transcriptional regulator [Pseudoclavibacter sp. RFBH5]PPG26158.1 transcriptional regulator [Pseudoclavibacter sp. RFBI4]